MTKARPKARVTIVSNGVASSSQSTSKSHRRNAILLGEEDDCDHERDGKDGNAKNKAGSGSATHKTRLNNSDNSEVKKTEEVKGSPALSVGQHAFI
ncbi:hypothetical protein BGX24_008348 [Mortierella sp. AD032]|nr:hypothetical protein BGX24_008348 [Mortierella sp. AD032]